MHAMKDIKVSLIFLYFYYLLTSSYVTSYAPKFFVDRDPDQFRNVTQLIKARGYPEEEHRVITQDGFILSIQRITGPRHSCGTPNANKPVVLLQHGLLDSSAAWVILDPPEQSLGFILADMGYDVWLSNVRGNVYSTAHVALQPSQPEFWAWSWDEMAKYDIPAFIGYILNVTGKQQLTYIGHSQGTIVGFAAFEDQKIASKVDLFIALAPVAWVYHSSSTLLNSLAAFDVSSLFILLGFHDFAPTTKFMQNLLPLACKLLPSLCDDLLGMLCGWDTTNINNTRLPVLVSHMPSGTSVQNIIHWSQLERHDKFQKFDFGDFNENVRRYGTGFPPEYDLSLVRLPVAIFFGDRDDLSDPTDVKRLLNALHHVVHVHEEPTYSHVDFTWGKNAHYKVYPVVLKLLTEYSRNNNKA
jgi:pimeloyl-ACP methyl ester carboxylesterase